MLPVAVKDECLWLSHLPASDFKTALASMHPGSKVELLVNGKSVTFERMAQGGNPAPTSGFRPVGLERQIWRELFLSKRNEVAEVDFAGTLNA